MQNAGPTATDRAHAAIRNGIIDGTHRPGALLSEKDLAAAVGVSRTPVRAALARLQEEGWVAVFPQRGVLVHTVTPAEAKDLTEARLTLEVAGVTQAGPARRRQLAAELAQAVEDQRSALAAGRVADFIELTTAFHRSFVDVGANRVLADVARRLGDRQRQLLFLEQDRLLDRAEDIVREHARLLDLLAEDDPSGFAEALRGHLARTHDLELRPPRPTPST